MLAEYSSHTAKILIKKGKNLYIWNRSIIIKMTVLITYSMYSEIYVTNVENPV